jgi:hypothetical protein
MGKRYEYASVTEKGFFGVSWQRAYIDGFMAPKDARAFALGMDLVGAPKVVQARVVDMQWGRPTWLFKTVVDVLSGNGPATPTAKRRTV